MPRLTDVMLRTKEVRGHRERVVAGLGVSKPWRYLYEGVAAKPDG
ncbi:MAG TPA: hypothetical protein VFA62_00685 [Acidimicrobiia bacterium]|nr:hypothetical protein [Acidimicrobiia bacterium]